MRFIFESPVAVPRERVFAWFEAPGSLAELMRGGPKFRLDSRPERVREGLLVRVRVRLGGVWIPLAFEHGRHDPPRSMRERRVGGFPFARFEHVHEFEEQEGGTIVRDVIDIQLPAWLGGELATRLFVAPFVRRLFAFRSGRLRELVIAAPPCEGETRRSVESVPMRHPKLERRAKSC